ncbi:MAG TPA: malto-oligosyltrehalose synthase [Thermoanaerobaculia bacterium]|jgi:(1->4)-alpha-D-glucan 1-alpha-D-glucosylmutase|nr:malto-oligosyltrehalose synthase [Thermoanaerobaculia bacterium]
MYRVPLATYRLQFNSGFTFDSARRIASYLAELGISDIYASPILKARKGSPHGYDVVDATALNPELGSEDDFNALHDELQRNELGLLLDVVPNHMAASSENAWWMSVLENGPRSRFVHYFDIDANPKVLLPILGRPYGEVLEAQEIKLGFDRDGFFFTYYEHRLPLAPESYRLILREIAGSSASLELHEIAQSEEAATNSKFLKETISRIYEEDAGFRTALNAEVVKINGDVDRLDALLDAQWYRLAYWRIASEKINYRRFFDVTDLVGVRVENPEVFEARNRRTLELIAEGKVTGLRIDHIDGLYDPIGHMKKLQSRIGGDEPFYIVVEKILTDEEQLPREFPVSGTTGYDFLSTLNNLFVDGAGLAKLDEFYRSFTGVTKSFADIAYERKKQVIHELFSGEMRRLGKDLSGLAMADRNARDFAPAELALALTEVTACLEVYRTYIRDEEVSAADREIIQRALGCARERSGASLDPRLFTFLERVLLVDPPSYAGGQRDHWLAFVMRWQQFTGRVMAKGVEDTAFYNYNRLLTLNEVGGDPGREPQRDGLEEFHQRNERIARDGPDTLNATSTHDTKRSQDARARISVLSEIPEQWAAAVSRWSKMNAPLRQNDVPDPNVELLVYQNLLSVWPIEGDRFRLFLEKASREAKTHTSWIVPNSDYEHALQEFGDALLTNEDFRRSFTRLQKRVAYHGFLNALSQVVLKIASPGVPDFYQGTELWDFSLVDPDNRRPVDYEKRMSLLREVRDANPSELLRRWPDGRIKLFVTWKALQLRKRFARESYRPIHGERVCAFMRGDDVAVAVPRSTVSGRSSLDLSGRWRNVLTNEIFEGGDPFASFPVAIFTRDL